MHASAYIAGKVAGMVLLLILLLFPGRLFAQDEEGFTADRPGATTGVDVMPKGRIQWETGIAAEYSKIEVPKSNTWAINSSMIRWGMLKNAELRFQFNCLYKHSSEEDFVGFSDVAIGSKIHLYEGKKVIPAMSLLANVYIPGGKDSYYLPENIGGLLGLLCQNQLSSVFTLGYEVTFIWSYSERPVVLWGINLGAQASEKVSLSAEVYNSNDDASEWWMGLGFALQLAKRLQLDIATDINLEHLNKYNNIQVGLSWQITK